MSSYEGDPVCCLVQEYSVKTSICEVCMEIIRTKQKRNSMGIGEGIEGYLIVNIW